MVRLCDIETNAEEESLAESSKCGGKGECKGEVLLGKMPRIKIEQREEDEELRYGDDVRGVQCKDGIERLAMFGGEGGRCVAMPY